MEEFEKLCTELYAVPVGDTVSVTTAHGWSDYKRGPAHLIYLQGTHDLLGDAHVYRLFDAAVGLDSLKCVH